MPTLKTRIEDLATRIGTEFKTIRALTGALTNLTTTDKSNLVAAINEVRSLSANAGAQINDTTPGASTTYSSNKINTQISAATAALVASSPAALDTLNELAAALGNDANYAATTSTALGNRLRFDAAQTLTAPQKAQAGANMGSAQLVDTGVLDTDFAAVFTAALA